jgi:hypothetical protein
VRAVTREENSDGVFMACGKFGGKLAKSRKVKRTLEFSYIIYVRKKENIFTVKHIANEMHYVAM